MLVLLTFLDHQQSEFEFLNLKIPAAFLIPYLTCAFLFGFPVVYLELLAGQNARVSPPILFRRIMPVLEGMLVDLIATYRLPNFP